MNENDKKMPFFSFIVPAYNTEKDLEKCVNSILAQTFEDFEVILIDDGSTDATPEICDHFVEIDYRVHVIHKSNAGVVAARNDGLFSAAGKYICHVDGDDWIDKEFLQEAVKVLNMPNPPDIFIYGFKMIMEDKSSVLYACSQKPGLYNKEQLKDVIYPKMMMSIHEKPRKRFISSTLWDKIILKELLQKHYCRDSSLFSGEDMVSAYECMLYAEQVYISPLNLYFYNRFSKSSMHEAYHVNLFENNRRVTQYLRSSLGDGKEFYLDRQINKVEYDGLIECIYQEVKFAPSIHKGAGRLKEKLRKLPGFLVCPLDGLSAPEQCFILILSFRVTFFPLFIAKILTWMIHVLRRFQ